MGPVQSCAVVCVCVEMVKLSKWIVCNNVFVIFAQCTTMSALTASVCMWGATNCLVAMLSSQKSHGCWLDNNLLFNRQRTSRLDVLQVPKVGHLRSAAARQDGTEAAFGDVCVENVDQSLDCKQPMGNTGGTVELLAQETRRNARCWRSTCVSGRVVWVALPAGSADMSNSIEKNVAWCFGGRPARRVD